MTDAPQRAFTLDNLFRIAEWHHTLAWTSFRDGVDIFRLSGDGKSGSTSALLRFQPGACVPLHEHVGYEHILVLTGSQVDENGNASAGSLIVNPPSTRHSVVSESGCIVLAIYERPVAFVDPSGAPPV